MTYLSLFEESGRNEINKGFPRKSGPCVGTKFKVIDVNDSVVVIGSPGVCSLPLQ